MMKKLICGVGVNSAGKIIERKTYSAWIKLLKMEKEISSQFKDYAKFHEWTIKQHGYGSDEMHLSCISSTLVSKDTVFYLPKRLCAMIKPKQLGGGYGVIQRNLVKGGCYFNVQINHKHIGTTKCRTEAVLMARTAMLARIHTLAAELKKQLSNEAYEAIMAM